MRSEALLCKARACMQKTQEVVFCAVNYDEIASLSLAMTENYVTARSETTRQSQLFCQKSEKQSAVFRVTREGTGCAAAVRSEALLCKARACMQKTQEVVFCAVNYDEIASLSLAMTENYVTARSETTRQSQLFCQKSEKQSAVFRVTREGTGCAAAVRSEALLCKARACMQKTQEVVFCIIK
ncbi:hypothetical protein EP073_09005 [Geovibrio thiophilus]|uniref:Uncharacterized protein n=1 Tax=Geovibrio thiophilus TaxID=139438 RepID=A0A3R5YZT5_9BACT|nr:hypothetical protein [Geovibrio thiophilus]QAR33533.1 hypothetical protein EP073_09005 [Geovibrio thiophilus]